MLNLCHRRCFSTFPEFECPGGMETQISCPILEGNFFCCAVLNASFFWEVSENNKGNMASTEIGSKTEGLLWKRQGPPSFFGRSQLAKCPYGHRELMH